MKVSVHMITYNHAPFIVQAIESVLMQQVNFAYELVIGEDCSTDGTRAIIEDYQRRHPDKIRLLLREHNVGAAQNDIEVYFACQGQYIAWLEGDDYWTAPDKLQKQVDFLDTHPEYVACFHSATVLAEDSTTVAGISGSRKTHWQLADLLEELPMQCAATLFRNRLVTEFPQWYYTDAIGDWEMIIFLAHHGPIAYIDEVMSVYRQHRGGVYTSAKRIARIQDRLTMYKHLNAHLHYQYNQTIRAIMARHNHDLAVEYLEAGDYQAARTAFRQSLSLAPFTRRIPLRRRLRLLGKLYGLDIHLTTPLRGNR